MKSRKRYYSNFIDSKLIIKVKIIQTRFKMKNLTIYILLLCAGYTSFAQNAPTWVSTDACNNTYIGSITIEFDHDLDVYPLPYDASYYNSTTGDYEEITITSSPYTISNLSAGEYELEVFISDVDIMEFCAEVYGYDVSTELTLDKIDANCFSDNGRIFFRTSDLLLSSGEGITALVYDSEFNLVAEKNIYSPTAFILNMASGDYSVHITLENGCEHWYTISIDIIPLKISFNLVSIEKACLNDGSIDIYVDPANGPYSYVWTKKDSEEEYYTQDLTNISSGTYCLTFSKTSNSPTCEYTDTCIVVPTTLDFEPFVDHICDDAEKTGKITIDTKSTYSYEWNTDPVQTTNIISGLSSGSYCVTISSNIDDCVHSECFDVNVLESIEIQNISIIKACPTKADGSISFEIYPLTYDVEVIWDDLPESEIPVTFRENLAAGEYNVTISNSCETITETIKVEYYCSCNEWKESVNLFKHSNDCISTPEPDGLIKLKSLNDESFKWSTGVTGTDIIDLSAGEYTVTITDNPSGCTKSFTFDIDMVDGVEVELVELLAACEGLEQGRIEVNIIGDSFILYWIGTNNHTNTIENLLPGIYTLKVTDGCSIRTFKYEVPTSEVSIVDYSKAGCSPSADIDVEIEGTFPPFEIEWETGDIGTLNNIEEDKTYEYVITDSQGCQFEGEYLVPSPIDEIVRIKPCEDISNGSITFQIHNPDEETIYINYDFGPCGECENFPFINGTTDSLLTINLTGLEGDVPLTFNITIGGCFYTHTFNISERKWDKEYLYSEEIDGIHYCVYDRVCDTIVIDTGLTIPATIETNETDGGSFFTSLGLFSDCGSNNLICEDEIVGVIDEGPIKMRSLEAVLFYQELGINNFLWLEDLMLQDPCSYWWVCPNGSVQPSRASGALGIWGGTWQGNGSLDENGCREIECETLFFFSDNYTICSDSLNWLPEWIEPYVNQNEEEKCKEKFNANVYSLINTFDLLGEALGWEEDWEGTELLDFIDKNFENPARYCATVQFCLDDLTIISTDIDSVMCIIPEDIQDEVPVDFNNEPLDPCQEIEIDDEEVTHVYCPKACSGDKSTYCHYIIELEGTIEIPKFTNPDTTTKTRSNKIIIQPTVSETEFTYFADYVTEHGILTHTPISKTVNGRKLVSTFYNNSYELHEIENVFYMYEDFRDGYNFTITQNDNSYTINSGVFLAKQQQVINSQFLELESAYFDGTQAYISGSYSGTLNYGVNTISTSTTVKSFTCIINKDYTLLDFNENSEPYHFSSNGHLFNYSYFGTQGTQGTSSLIIGSDITIYKYHYDIIYGDEYIVFGGTGNLSAEGNMYNIINPKGVQLAKINSGHIEWIKEIGNVDQVDNHIAIDTDKDKNIYIGYSFKDGLSLNGISLNAIDNYDNLILKIDEIGNIDSYYHIDNESDEFIIDLKNIENVIAIGLTVKGHVYERKIGDFTFFQFDRNESKSINSLFEIKNMIPFSGQRSNKSISEKQTFDVVPNPASNTIKIVKKINTKKSEIDITSISGQTVLSTKDTKGNIDVSALKSGIYIITLTTENDTYSKKLIITK
jgi:hypothetical protein